MKLPSNIPHEKKTVYAYRTIEVLAKGLSLFHGVQLAVGTTLVSPVGRDGAALLQADLIPGAALTEAARRKRRYVHPELHKVSHGDHCAGSRRMVVRRGSGLRAPPSHCACLRGCGVRSPLGWHRLRCRPAGAGQQPEASWEEPHAKACPRIFTIMLLALG